MNPTPPVDTEPEKGLTEEENENVEELSRLRPAVVYEVVRSEGEKEIRRPLSSLWWSGIAAGLGISTSFVAQSVLHAHLPDAPWRPLVEGFGYCLGFLIVIIGRLQLFTENTITAVLPLITCYSRSCLLGTARLWGIVFLANMVGTGLTALLIRYGGIARPESLTAMYAVAHHVLEQSALTTLGLGVPAGFLVAAIVWMLPSAEGSEFWVITALTWLIAAAGFSHVVAGSTEAFLLVMGGQMTFVAAWLDFILPALAGNIIGGTVLFAFLAYGQVREEM